MKKSILRLSLLASVVSILAACAAIDAPQAPLACDMQSIGQLKIDTQTRIIAVQPFKAGDEVRLTNSPAPHVKTPVDVCMVKLIVGPGNAGPANLSSTSPGIGVEVYLPAPTQWNQIIRAYGSGGWAGGYYADATRLGQSGGGNALFLAAVQKGYAVSGSDHGHGGTVSGRNAAFAINPDGSINTTLWRDFSERSMLEQALKTKAVVKAYYGKAHKYAYFDGFSTGGRQGYKLAQKYPEQYDGILAGAPAFNWTRFITSELQPQIVMQRDLGSVLPNSKTHAVSALAMRSCGGAQANWGFLLDPLSCKYDPTRDAAALCVGVAGEGGVQGASREASCLNLKEAQAYNKIWYGLTRDGSAPSPAQDNGGSGRLAAGGNQLWWGLTRGTDLTSLAGQQAPFPIASQLAAMSLGNLSIAQKGFLTHPAGNGDDAWKAMTYTQLAQAFDRGLQLQSAYADINTDSVDLSKLRDRGAKVLSYHGLSDNLIMPQGSLQYFDRLAANMGGVEKVQAFNRLFFIAGHGHAGLFNLSASVGVDGKVISPATVPLPQPATGRDELFNALRDWVEKGYAPERLDLVAADGSKSLPICSHPRKPVFTGSNPNAASSYTCR